MEANLGLIYTQKFYEVTKCVTGNVNLWPFPTVLGINQAKWDSLSADEQGWLTDAAGKIDDESIAILTDPSSTLVKDLCDTGLKFGTASKSDAAALATAEQPVYDKYTASEPNKSLLRPDHADQERDAGAAGAHALPRRVRGVAVILTVPTGPAGDPRGRSGTVLR